MRPASSAQLFERQPLERGAKRPPTEGARPVQMQPSPSAESLLKGGGFSTLKRSNSEEAAAADLMSSLSGLSRQASRATSFCTGEGKHDRVPGAVRNGGGQGAAQQPGDCLEAQAAASHASC